MRGPLIRNNENEFYSKIPDGYYVLQDGERYAPGDWVIDITEFNKTRNYTKNLSKWYQIYVIRGKVETAKGEIFIRKLR